MAAADQLYRIVDNRQVLEAEEIELYEADLLHVLHGILGGDRTALLVLVDRAELFQHVRGDHDPGRMGRGVAGKPFQTQRNIEKPAHLRVGVGQLVQLRFLLQGLLQGDPEHFGNQLGDPVHIAVGHVEGAPHVPDHPPCRHGAEGDDLADLVPAVLVGNILDHLLAPVLAEVHVDIRHGNPLRVEKTLEQEVIGNRVDIGDPDGDRQPANRPPTPCRDRPESPGSWPS